MFLKYLLKMIKKSGNPETLFTVTQKYFMALK